MPQRNRTGQQFKSQIPGAGQDWHREDIKAEIRKRGQTLESLALSNGFGRSSVRAALSRPSPAVEALIARFLGVQPQDIWPSRYAEDGAPKRDRKG